MQGCPDRPRSDSPEELGFRRRPMVRWLDPGPLVAKETKAIVSGVFGSHADRREMQAALEPPAELDYSDRDAIWFDYAADTGDGWDSTYTMASLLARQALAFDREGSRTETERGRFLVLGGDAVYPAASEDLYRDRFLGPFGAALPCAPEDAHPDLFALPGNHDWYDGLTGFLRIFCQGRWVGGWRTHQSRSYFALKLPHRWWLWAIDISFDAFIDRPQLEYFAEVGRIRVEPGDRIVLCTAKPSWVHEGLIGDVAYTAKVRAKQNLAQFQRQIVEPSGATVAVTLSGDLHHYARYAAEEGLGEKITAGGAGAYLYPTHNLPERIAWPEGGRDVAYRLRSVFPDRARSRRLRAGVLLAPVANPGFVVMAAVVVLLFGWLIQFAVRTPGETFGSAMHHASFRELALAMVRYPGSGLMAAVVLGAIVHFADAAGWRRLLFGGLHAAAQLLLILLSLWVASRPNLGGAGFAGAFIGIAGAGGGVASGFLMGLYLFMSNAALGRHPNEVFAAQHIDGYKNFLRMRIGPDGSLSIYPIGVERVPRRWRIRPDGEAGEPWFEPEGGWGQVQPFLIEDPVVIPPGIPSA